MTRLVDIVNFNADASCLPSARWLGMLDGGADSALCRWLGLYVTHRRKVVLGFVGGAVADMAMLNPEAIALVNAHPDVFESVLRPFAHDIALLRSTAGFDRNVALGARTLRREFRRVVDYFLPPEFMLTSAQVRQLAAAGIEGLFINPARFKDELQSRIPASPYLLEGVLGSRIRCLPFAGELTEAYLRSIHFYDAGTWNAAVGACAGTGPVHAWRDGESSFLVSDGLAREEAWLSGEDARIERIHLSEALAGCDFASLDAGSNAFRTYPTHSFSAWFKENRMLGYLGRLERFEARLADMPVDAQVLWLQAINSDVLSSVEKDSPSVMLGSPPGNVAAPERFTIWRSDRGFEGEDFLARLEALLDGDASAFADDGAPRPHVRKLLARTDYVRGLLEPAA
jgi:hypothetical protein